MCVPPVVGDHHDVACAAENHLLLHDLSACYADTQRLETASPDSIHEHCVEAWMKKHKEPSSLTPKEMNPVKINNQLSPDYNICSGYSEQT